VKGLNALQGIRVTDVNITMTKFADGSNMHGNVIIPNPSVMTLTIGNMTQDLFAAGKPIGNTTMNNVVLKPGDNIFPVTSITDQVAIIPLVGPGHQFPTGVLEIEARTRDVTYQGNVLPYFTEAMKANPVHFNLDIGPNLRQMGMGALLDGPKASSTLSSSVATPSATSAME
jgi:Protein of unknown function (DUF3712)